MMNNPLDFLEDDIQETFHDFADHRNISIRQFLVEEPDFYQERKKKLYKKPVKIPSRVKINPLGEELSEVGKKAGANVIFTFLTKDLREKRLFDKTGLKVTDIDVVQYNDTNYKILKIVPSAMVGETFLLYKFECREE